MASDECHEARCGEEALPGRCRGDLSLRGAGTGFRESGAGVARFGQAQTGSGAACGLEPRSSGGIRLAYRSDGRCRLVRVGGCRSGNLRTRCESRPCGRSAAFRPGSELGRAYGISLVVIERAGANSLLYSGLDLFHSSGRRALASAKLLSSGNPDSIVDGFVGLNAARRESKIALAIIRTWREMDDTIFDIFV